MRHDHYSLSILVSERKEKIVEFLLGLGVKVTGRFISKKNGR